MKFMWRSKLHNRINTPFKLCIKWILLWKWVLSMSLWMEIVEQVILFSFRMVCIHKIRIRFQNRSISRTVLFFLSFRRHSNIFRIEIFTATIRINWKLNEIQFKWTTVQCTHNNTAQLSMLSVYVCTHTIHYVV